MGVFNRRLLSTTLICKQIFMHSQTLTSLTYSIRHLAYCDAKVVIDDDDDKDNVSEVK